MKGIINMAEILYEELVASAEAAFANKQYAAALDYYKRALELDTDNVEILTKVGELSIVYKRYEDAHDCFMHVLELDPENGDGYYNMGNLYFWKQMYSESLDMFTKAESLSCSGDTIKKIYFLKGMLCKARGDMESALVYLEKYEKAYEGNVKAIDPRVLHHKVELYVALGKNEEAELAAAKLVNIQPTVFENYVMYYQILIALQKYDKAEEVLLTARDYATLNENDEYHLGILEASFYKEMMGFFYDDEEVKSRCENYAMEIYTEMLASDNPSVQKNVVKLCLAELYMDGEKYDQAIDTLNELIPSETIEHVETGEIKDAPKKDGYAEVGDGTEYSAYSNDPIDAYGVSNDPIDAYGVSNDPIDAYGVSNDPIDAYGVSNDPIDAYGVSNDPIDAYGSGEVSDVTDDSAKEDEADTTNEAEDTKKYATYDVTDDFIEQVRFILMSCYIKKGDCELTPCNIKKTDYENALSLASNLTDSNNAYRKYMSKYCRAYSMRELSLLFEEITTEEWERSYAETIAFYRAQMIKNPKDRIAIILRARMYAEQGKYEKAGEMTKLLEEEERKALEKYIDEWRNGVK